MKFFCAAILGITFLHSPVIACPSCYGASSGPMIEGMNAAVLSMLGITLFMFTGISLFFFLMKRKINIHHSR